MKIFFLASVLGLVVTITGCVVEGGGCPSSYNYYYPSCYFSRPVISTASTDVYYAPPVPDVYYYRY